MATEEHIETEVGRIVRDVIIDETGTDFEGEGEEGDIVLVSTTPVEVIDKKKEKKGKKGKKEKKKKEKEVVEEPEERKEPEPSLKIPGLEVIKLRSVTQKMVGCLVGTHVTAESPWTYVDKNKIEDYLDEIDETADIYPLKELIEKYKNENVLIGYDAEFEPEPEQDDYRFYFALTDAARKEIEDKLHEERLAQEEILKTTIHKTARPWESYGSEREVDESITTVSRPYIELEIETTANELLQPVHFDDRGVEDAKDGFVTIGPGRSVFEGVQRIRIDSTCQAVPTKHEEEAQTDPGLPVNMWSQYVYDMETALASLPKSDAKRGKKEEEAPIVFAEADYMEKSLQYNETFDLYLNDYPQLVLREEDTKVKETNLLEEFMAFTDVGYCKGKFMRCIAWHPFWSGVVAIAYSDSYSALEAPLEPVAVDAVLTDTFEKKPVLVWTFQDALNPLFILEAPREISALQWCPTDENILVGGSVGGQIFVWDLTGKIEEAEKKEFLTPDQQRYRLVMHSLLDWVKPQLPTRYVRPAVMSNSEQSHIFRIHQLRWLTPYYTFTRYGKYIPNDEENEPSKQFMTVSQYGEFYIWDLNDEPVLPPEKDAKKKKERKRPEVLTKGFSKYKDYDRYMCPTYKLLPPNDPRIRGLHINFFDTTTHTIRYRQKRKDHTQFDIDISQFADKNRHEYGGYGSGEEEEGGVMMKMEKKESGNEKGEEEKQQAETTADAEKPKDSQTKFFREEIIKVQPEESDDEEQIPRSSWKYRRCFRASLDYTSPEPGTYIVAATEDASVVHLNWDGYDFNRGEAITTETLKLASITEGVHVYPVSYCTLSPFIDDLFLTVGGRLFAFWKMSHLDQPVFWRFEHQRLTTAMWSPFRPAMFFVGNSEGVISIWDIMVRSDEAVLYQRVSSSALTSFSYHTLPIFGGRSIFGVADFNSSFRLFYFPPDFLKPKPDELQWVRRLADREIEIQDFYQSWSKVFIERNAQELKEQKEAFEAAARLKAEQEQRAEAEAAARARLEEEEAKKFKQQSSVVDPVQEAKIQKLKQAQEVHMKKVLLEKKNLNKEELLEKQAPILMQQKLEREKREKQKNILRQQHKIFDKAVLMLFPDVIDKVPTGPSEEEELEKEIMEVQNELMAEYVETKENFIDYLSGHPYTRKFKWDRVVEEGKKRRGVLDFSLYLRKEREQRYETQRDLWLYTVAPMDVKMSGLGAARLRGSRRVITLDEEDQGEGMFIDDDDDDDSEADIQIKETEIDAENEEDTQEPDA